MPIASKSPEKMCRPQNSQCMSRIPGAGFGTCRTFVIVFNNDFVHPTIVGSRYDICACHQVLLKPPMDNAMLAMLAEMQREAR